MDDIKTLVTYALLDMLIDDDTVTSQVSLTSLTSLTSPPATDTSLTPAEYEYLNFVRNQLRITLMGETSLQMIQNALMITPVPTLNDVVREWSYYIDCPCLHVLSVASLNEAIGRILTELSCPMRCEYIMAVAEYKITTNRSPTDDELREYLTNRDSLNSNPDEYCTSKRHCVPTPGLHNIKPVNIEDIRKRDREVKEYACSICQEDIDKNSMVYELPCGHLFCTAGDDKCLGGENNILAWLGKSRLCPNCKKEVNLDV